MHQDMSPELFLANYIERLNIPIRGLFHITGQCNLKCRHCFLKSRWNADHLDKESIIRIAKEAQNSGCIFITLAGGEPLMHPDFNDIYSQLFDLGLKVILATNGTLITSDIADLLSEKPPFKIKISLYGTNEETFSSVISSGLSFKEFNSSLKLLKDRDISFTLVAMILSVNKIPPEEIEAFSNIWDAPVEFHTNITAGFDGDLSPLKYRISPKEMSPYYEANARNYNKLFYIERRPRGPKWSNDGLHNCNCGRTSFFVDCFSRLHPCSLSPLEGIDLNSVNFEQGWAEIRSRLSEWIAPTPFHQKHRSLTMCPPFIALQGEDFDIKYHLEVSDLQNRKEDDFVSKQDKTSYFGLKKDKDRFNLNAFLEQISGFVTKCSCSGDDCNPYQVG